MAALLMQEHLLTYVYSTEARLHYPEGYSSESWISAMVLWGDALSVVHTFPPREGAGSSSLDKSNQLQS